MIKKLFHSFILQIVIIVIEISTQKYSWDSDGKSIWQIDITNKGVSSIGAGGHMPPRFSEKPPAVHYFVKMSALLDVILYENKENDFISSVYSWIRAVHYFGAPKKRGEETPMITNIFLAINTAI